jgi:transposase-like protein
MTDARREDKMPRGRSHEMGSQKRYGREFKLEAAKLVVERGYTYAAAAESLGATAWSIRQWVKKFRASGELPPAGQVVPEAEELKKLRKELKQVRLENEILKKAAAYFAKDSL